MTVGVNSMRLAAQQRQEAADEQAAWELAASVLEQVTLTDWNKLSPGPLSHLDAGLKELLDGKSGVAIEVLPPRADEFQAKRILVRVSRKVRSGSAARDCQLVGWVYPHRVTADAPSESGEALP